MISKIPAHKFRARNKMANSIRSRIVLITCCISILSASLLIGCTTQGQKKTPEQASGQVQELFTQAKQDWQRKDYARAIPKLKKVANSAPDSNVAAESLEMLGDSSYTRGSYNEALQYYSKILKSTITVPFEPRVSIKAARCLYNLDNMTAALDQLDPALRNPTLPPDLLTIGLKLRLQILKRMNAPLEELKTYLHLHARAETEAAKEEYRVAAVGLVDSSLSPEQLETVATGSGYSVAQAPAMFRLAQISFERSEFAKARTYFSEVVRSSANTEIAEKSAEYLKQIDARETVNTRRIGAILPLTGKLSKIGYKTLRGIQLGLGIFGNKRSNLELAVIDSAGNPAVARRAVEKLVTEDHVVAVIGSLSSKEASVIAAKCQELGVPNFVLSQKSGITDIGDFVFRNALTSEMQVKQLVETAINKRNFKKFALLYPKDAYGIEYASLFWDEVVKLGGEIRGVYSYTPGDTDFNVAVKKLVGTADSQARGWEYKLRYDEWKKGLSASARKKQPEDLLPPIVDFDAVFIPDSVKALGQIAPTFAYNEVHNVEFIGTNLWNTTAVIERAGKALKNPLFVDSFLPNDPVLAQSEFFKNFTQVFGESPEEFELQGYDSALMLRRALESSASTRVDVQRYLAGLNNFEGALGMLKMTESREIIRPLVSLTIHDDQIIKE